MWPCSGMPTMGGGGGDTVPAAFRKKAAPAGSNGAMSMPGMHGMPNPADFMTGASMPASSMAPMGGADPSMMQMMQMMQMQQMMVPQVMPQMMGQQSTLPSMPGAQNSVMQQMLNQQMQFQLAQQQQLYEQELQDQQDQQQFKALQQPRSRAKKELEIPPSLQAHREQCQKLLEFIDKHDFEERHSVRLLNEMGKRMDTFEEDLETLYMIMHAAKSHSALLVETLKRMEDGIFQARDAATRAQWRRAQEIREEAVAASKAMKSTGGSVRKAFEAQQKAAAREMEANRAHRDSRDNRNRSPPRRGRSRSRSRSRSRGRSRSRSRGRRR
mmetsp:Transcript_120416/g.190814  ORF Transcript_120416/g.190814 Transcript_120416/m.190814 type:complete len:327 (-) Transcript_120416:17-997(-)